MTGSLKVLVVDDERLAREELKRLLRAFPEIEIVAEATHGEEAIATIRTARPDAVFLDIAMPGANGLDVVAALEPPVPSVVFVTAYDEHAIHAFEINAIDFLVKPVDPVRLSASVGRLLERHGAAHGEEGAGRERLGEHDRVFLRERDQCWFVPVSDLFLLESEGSYTKVHFPDGTALLYRSLSDLEARLPASAFFRVNRAQIINLRAIESVAPWFSGSLKARLNGGIEVEFSRRAALLFRERMSL
ncbi:MAG TPA: LytTR family DNA-binding domain-containing protein [Chthoniobacteraceae bacterium]|nr:LytTR family DNA-binding domain-containing protein [Chthoniobacteraceae bacterium]